jgi:hypothetical protein
LPNQRRDDYDLVFQCALLLLIQVYHGEFIAACQTAFANRLEIRDRAAGMRRASGHVKSQDISAIPRRPQNSGSERFFHDEMRVGYQGQGWAQGAQEVGLG